MLLGMGAAAAGLQEGALQVGPQQLAAARPMAGAGFGEHIERLAQGRHAAGDEGGGNGLDPMAPEQLQQLLQTGKVGLLEFGEGQAQAAIDLQIHPPGAEPVAAPVVASRGTARSQGLQVGDATSPIDRHPPAPIPPMAAGGALG